MIEPARHLRQAVCALQRRPAVLAVQEFLRKSEPRRAARFQLRDAFETLRRRQPLRSCERIGVVETERHADPETLLRELRLKLREARRALPAQQLECDRAGVFGIDVDRPGPERGEDDGRVAEPLLVNDACFPCVLHRVAQDLAKDVRFREAFGAHVDCLCPADARRDEEHDQPRDRGHAPALPGSAFDSDRGIGKL